MSSSQSLQMQQQQQPQLLTTRDFSVCPRCQSKTKKTTSIDGSISEFWYECTVCNTFINSYVPQDHQLTFHKDGRQYKSAFGGFGSGKTTTSREELYKHWLLTPNGQTLIGAHIVPQYEQTIKKDIEKDFPAAFVKYQSLQKSYIDLHNGHRVMFRPLDDAGKLRSLNLTAFLVVEASEVDGDIYEQLKTRLRNVAAGVQAVNPENGELRFEQHNGVAIPLMKATWFKGLIESNPDAGWVKTKVLNDSIQVFRNGKPEQHTIYNEARDKFTSSHITETKANAYLPANYYEQVSKNKPQWWINRYLNGSFNYSEGLVYPTAADSIIMPEDIPDHWRKLIAFDYGLSDKAVWLFAAVDPHTGDIHFYRELTATNRNIEELAKMYLANTKDIYPGTLYRQLIDPKSSVKRDYNKKSLADHFGEYGIYFEPGAISIDARIFRLNTFFEAKRIKIHATCKNLVSEVLEYKFPEKKLTNSTKNPDKPVDKNNHSINAAEWIAMSLPADPNNIHTGVYNYKGERIDLEPNRARQKMEEEYSHAQFLYESETEEATSFGSDSFFMPG